MIKSTANKYKESGKDQWMTSQTKPVGGGRNIIDTTVTKPGMSVDTFSKGAYEKHFSCVNVVQGDPAHKYATKKVELA